MKPIETIKTTWLNDLHFRTNIDRETINFDARYKDIDSKDGAAPLRVFLSSIIACSSMMAASVLKDQSIKFKNFHSDIETEHESSQQNPHHITRFDIRYFFEGLTANDEKIAIDAIKQSHEKYCPMIVMIEKIAPVQYEIYNDNKLIGQSENWRDKDPHVCTTDICDSYYSYH